MNAWRWIIAAGTVFAVLELAEDFIATPLRAWSSTIAAVMLRLAGYAIEQTGTILATSRFTFDVVPACSGSTTLQVLLALVCIWVGQHPGLSGWRRIATLVAAAVMAVIANGLRVAVLVALGDVRMEPVEGVLHAVIGVSTFLVALGSVVLLCELLATPAASATTSPSLRADGPRRWAAGLAALVLIAPVLVWSLNAWMTSPLDAWGWIAWVAGVVIIVRAVRTQRGTMHHGLTWMLGGGGVLVTLGGAIIDVSIVQAGGALLLLAGGISLAGPRALAFAVPGLALIGIGLPVIGFALTSLTGWSGPTASVVLRAVLVGIAIGAALVLPRSGVRVATPVAAPSVPMLAVLALAVCGQLILAARRDAVVSADISFSYLHGDWVGSDVPISASTDLLLGGRNVIQRRYRADDEGQPVDVIVTRTGGDRHRAHPPEYCLTGAGWSITDATTRPLALTESRTVTGRVLTLQRNAESCVFVAWFSDGETVLPSFQTMLLVDAGRRVAGKRTDWVLVRVIATDLPHLHRFLAEFSPPAVPAAP